MFLEFQSFGLVRVLVLDLDDWLEAELVGPSPEEEDFAFGTIELELPVTTSVRYDIVSFLCIYSCDISVAVSAQNTDVVSEEGEHGIICVSTDAPRGC